MSILTDWDMTDEEIKFHNEWIYSPNYVEVLKLAKDYGRKLGDLYWEKRDRDIFALLDGDE